MIINKRKKGILEYLSDSDSHTLNELAQKCNVSMNTIRRDVNELVESGHVQKFYGGVSLARKSDSSFYKRATINQREKRNIAKHAASLVKNNDLIFIDSGSTTAQIVDFLNINYNLTIVTNNLRVVSKIIDVVNWNLIIVGTTLRHSSHSLIQVHNWDYLDSMNLGKAFLAATGLTIKSGATNSANEETIIKSKMMSRSNERFLLVDSTKFDQTSLLTFAKIEDFDAIITSGQIPQYFIDYFVANNIQFEITQDYLR